MRANLSPSWCSHCTRRLGLERSKSGHVPRPKKRTRVLRRCLHDGRLIIWQSASRPTSSSQIRKQHRRTLRRTLAVSLIGDQRCRSRNETVHQHFILQAIVFHSVPVTLWISGLRIRTNMRKILRKNLILQRRGSKNNSILRSIRFVFEWRDSPRSLTDNAAAIV